MCVCACVWGGVWELCVRKGMFCVHTYVCTYVCRVCVYILYVGE